MKNLLHLLLAKSRHTLRRLSLIFFLIPFLCSLLPAQLTVNLQVVEPICGAIPTGSITAFPSNGVPPFSYLWSTGDTTQAITGLGPGFYEVTVTDAASNGATASVLMNAPPIIIATLDVDGCSAPGTITANTSGGIPPYEYEWITGDTTQTITFLATGSYCVTITDSVHCGVVKCVNITGLPPAVTVQTTDVLCTGQMDGTATAIVTDGTPPFTYLWNTGDTTALITDLPPGMYTVTVTDNNGCTAVGSGIVSEPPPLSANCSSSDPVCQDDDNGSALSMPVGGTPPYSYLWNTGDTIPGLTGLVAGIYSVTVTDANGCSDVCTVVLEDQSNISLSVSSTDVTCFGFNNGTASALAANGVPPYTYAWSNGQSGANLSGLPPGTYDVTATDALGCTAEGSVSIATPPPLTLMVPHTDVTDCGGSDGTATAMVNGGTPPYNYLWSNGESTMSIGGLTAGSYTVTVTDANNCTVMGTILVEQPPGIDVTATATDEVCEGASDGTATAMPSGVPPYLYSWSNGGSTQTITGLAPGMYSVTVTDANGCSGNASVTILAAPTFTLDLSTADILCFGDATGSATAMAVGGVAPLSYLWSTGETSPEITGLTAGSYTVVVTDAAGCTLSETAMIAQPPLLTLFLQPTDLDCAGDSDGAISSTVNGGTPPYSYLWDTGDTDPNLSGLTAGIYALTVTDANGCTVEGSALVDQPPSLQLEVQLQGNVCDPAGVTAAAIVNGGTPPYDYLWSTGDHSATLTGLFDGVYSVTVTDANDCTVSETIVIDPAPVIVVSIQSTDISCFGAGDGSATASASGGTAPYDYVWNTGEMTAAIAGLEAGMYTVTATDANGCFGIATVAIGEPAALTLEVSSTDASCDGSIGGTATATVGGGTPPYSYAWRNGGSSATITGLSPGLYTVTATDANGCFLTASAEIGINNTLEASVEILNPPCAGSANGAALAVITGGTPPYDLMWSTGDTGMQVDGLSAGNYSLLVEDALGCQVVVEFDLIAVETPTCSIAITHPISVPGGSDGEVTVTASGGTPPYTYLWNTGGTNAVLGGLSEGVYSVVVTDANGCETSCSVSLGDPPAAKVGDKVWFDQNENGLQDPGEPGKGNVVVTLSGNDDQGNPLTLSTVTDAAGMYLFDPIPPGTYKLTFVLPQGYHFTLPNVGANEEVDSDVDTLTGMTTFFTLLDGDCILSWDAGIFIECVNVTNPGQIAGDEVLCGPGNDPGPIVEVLPPSGGVGALEYLWMKSTIGGPFNQNTWMPIPNSNTPNYDPPVIYQTTYYIRCVRRENCVLYLESNIVTKEVDSIAWAEIDGPNVVCVDEPATYTAAFGGANATYHWDFGPNADPQTADTPTAQVVWDGFGVATIVLTVVNDGCTATAVLPISISNSPIYCDDPGFTITAGPAGPEEVRVSWQAADWLGGPFTFTVQRSADGVSFDELASLDHQAGQTAYSWLDQQPMAGKNVYRVELRDADGHAIYSNEVEVLWWAPGRTFKVYPNPVTDWLTVEFDGSLEGDQLEIVSADGRLVRTVLLDDPTGIQQIDLSDLPSGMYFALWRKNEGGLRALKLMK